MLDPAVPVPANEAPTTRFSVAKNAVKNAVSNATAAAQRPSRATPPPAAPHREIESWLGELRGKATGGQAAPPPQPSAEPTRAMPSPESRTPADDATTAIPAAAGDDGGIPDDVSPTVSAEETRAIPVSRPEPADPEVATEKLNARGKKQGGEDRPRRGGGVSAQDLLRREGRL